DPDRYETGALGDSRERHVGWRAAQAGGNAGHVRSVEALAASARHARPRAGLAVEPVRTAAHAAQAVRAADEAGFLHDLAAEEDVVQVHARIDDGDDGAL